MNKNKERDYYVKLQMFGVQEYPKKGMKSIAKWLRSIADEIEKEKDLKVYTKNPIWKIMKTYE